MFIIFSSFVLFYINFSSPFSDVKLNESFPKPILKNVQQEFFFKDGCKITLIKEIDFNARILSLKKYENMIDSFIVPYDIVFGWDNMIKQDFLDKIKISQNNRWFFYKYKHNELFTENDIRENFDNFHIIPGEENILNLIENFSEGDFVNVKGYLVDLDCALIPFNRKTSISFKDRSSTSCEQILINHITKLN